MSDVEDHSDRNACIPPEVSLPSVSQNSSSSALGFGGTPKCRIVFFFLFKDYFDKKLSARNLKKNRISRSNSKGTKSSFILTLVLQRKSTRLPKLSVNENLTSLKVAWKN